MAGEIDELIKLAERCPAARAALFGAGLAEFVLPLYGSYDSGERLALLVTQLEEVWQQLGSPGERSLILRTGDELADRTVPEGESGPKSLALAQSSAAIVAMAVDLARGGQGASLRDACEEFELIANELNEEPGDNRRYLDALGRLADLSAAGVREALESFTKPQPRSSRGRRAASKLRKLLVELRKIVATDARPEGETVKMFRTTARGLALRPDDLP